MCIILTLCCYQGAADSSKHKMPLFHELSDRQKMFSSCEEIQLTLSPHAVQTHIVGVGSTLYLDPSHPAIPEAIKKELRFIKHVGKDVPEQGSVDSALYGKSLRKFKSLCGNHAKFYPVIHCMLLYEMPESVVAHNDFCDIELQVWVGVRQAANFKTKHKFSSRYITVPTKALVSADKLATVGLSLAVFESCCK